LMLMASRSNCGRLGCTQLSASWPVPSSAAKQPHYPPSHPGPSQQRRRSCSSTRFPSASAAERKLVLAPMARPRPPRAAPHIDGTPVKAIARAFRWRKMLETDEHATIKEIAGAERINPSYVSRILRLMLLAPATVEAVMTGGTTGELTLADVMAPFPVVWSQQQL
jgi:hypothetical protein